MEMSEPLAAPEGGGRLVENLMHFARVLRTAGLPIGPGQVLKAIEAVETVAITDREAFYWALHASMVNRRDQREVFDQAFHMFWRNPDYLQRLMGMILPDAPEEASEPKGEEVRRRVADAFRSESSNTQTRETEEIEIQAELTWSDRETLREMDFEQMSAEEMASARKVMAGMRLPVTDQPTRRFRPKASGSRPDMRATLRAQMRLERRCHPAPAQGADLEAPAAGRALRYLRLDGAVQPDAAALPARDHQRPATGFTPSCSEHA